LPPPSRTWAFSTRGDCIEPVAVHWPWSWADNGCMPRSRKIDASIAPRGILKAPFELGNGVNQVSGLAHRYDRRCARQSQNSGAVSKEIPVPGAFAAHLDNMPIAGAARRPPPAAFGTDRALALAGGAGHLEGARGRRDRAAPG
jgi:hypothetical protein